MNYRFTIGQWIGVFIFVVCCDGLPAAGFRGGTGWSLPLWILLALCGGMLGGLLMAKGHRVAGLVGGMIAGPMGLLAVFFYARNRVTIHTAETFIVLLLASLPGLGVYFVLRLLTDLMFPPRDKYVDRPRRIRDDEDDYDDDDRPRRRRDEDYDEEDRPRRRSRDDDEDEDDDRPRRSRRRSRDDD